MTLKLALNSIRGKSGKDTLIGLLESQGLTVGRVAFADILKAECARVLAGPEGDHAKLEALMHKSVKDSLNAGLALDCLPPSAYSIFMQNLFLGDHKEIVAPRSLRWHLQKYGTEYKREHLCDPDVWLNAGLKAIDGLEGFDVIVVTDMRLPNEYSALCDRGFKTVRIVRDWFIPGVDDQPYHISDVALMAHNHDALVLNHLGEPFGMIDQLVDQGVCK